MKIKVMEHGPFGCLVYKGTVIASMRSLTITRKWKWWRRPA